MMRTSSRFQPFTPSSLRTTGLRRLKTALSPSPASSVSSTRSFASTPRSSPSTTYTSASTSPASSDCGCDHHTHNGLQLMGLDSTLEDARPVSKPVSSARARLRAILMRRRRMTSAWDLQIEEEQKTFGQGLRVFEPRQKGEIAMASIFEVLDQRL